MSKKNTAPSNDATQEEELPQTGVRERSPNKMIRELQEQLAATSTPPEQPETPAPASEPNAENETWKKRYGDLRSHSQKKEAELAKLIKDKEDQLAQLTAASNQKMPKTKEEFEEWKAKFPDIVPFIEMLAEEKASQRTAKLEEQIGELTGKLSQTEEEKAQALLNSLVPDIEQVLESPEFKSWFLDRSPSIQNVIKTSTDPYEIADYINMYKASIGKPKVETPKPKSPDALDVRMPNGGGGGPDKDQRTYRFTTSQIKKMGPAEYEKNEAAIDEAEKLGLIYDDMAKKQWHNNV